MSIEIIATRHDESFTTAAPDSDQAETKHEVALYRVDVHLTDEDRWQAPNTGTWSRSPHYNKPFQVRRIHTRREARYPWSEDRDKPQIITADTEVELTGKLIKKNGEPGEMKAEHRMKLHELPDHIAHAMLEAAAKVVATDE